VFSVALRGDNLEEFSAMPLGGADLAMTIWAEHANVAYRACDRRDFGVVRTRSGTAMLLERLQVEIRV
jgi:hypothetical protein